MTSPKNRIFPIKTDPACLLKWTWSTIYFDSGTSASCHRTQKYAIDPNNFNNFHNLPGKIAARNLMLEGQWPQAGCQYCQKVEESGGVSDRQYQFLLQGDPCQHPPELNTNPTATEVTPTILEVYFTNTCNMACVYCGPHFSSRWEEENRKFKSTFANANDVFDVRASQSNPHYNQMVNDLWRYLEKDDHYKTLRRYHILGGEPFLLKELDASMDFWDQHPNMDLVFCIITNLNIPTERFKIYIDKFEKLVTENKIWQLQITASLDAWGPQQEYTRYGINLNQWQQNFELLLDKPWVQLSINSAVSALTIKQMPALIEKINQWNLSRGDNYIKQSFNITETSDSPYFFGGSVFDQAFTDILSLLPTGTLDQVAVKDQMRSMGQSIASSTRDINKINSLKNYLDILDQRRNTNWRTLFAWLDESFE